MAAGSVTTIERALDASRDGSATTLVSPVLEQRVEVVPRGGRVSRTVEERSEVLFVAAGNGVLRVGGQEHELVPETGAFLAAGEPVELEAGGEGLELVLVRTPWDEARAAGRPATVVLGDVEAEEAGIGREFRLLVGEAHGCRSVTQFVGYVPPGRAKMHNHPYDEVAYVLEGDGVLHWHDGESIPVGRGSCIHFPRLVFHSLENVGDSTLRIMGVFHPAGSPADRVEILDY